LPGDCLEARKRQGKGCTLPYCTLDVGLPAVGCHNLLDNVQAKACPTRLGSIQGLEDLPELLGRYATARILYIELHLLLELHDGAQALVWSGQRCVAFSRDNVGVLSTNFEELLGVDGPGKAA
jgi:hypothetical protein